MDMFSFIKISWRLLQSKLDLFWFAYFIFFLLSPPTPWIDDNLNLLQVLDFINDAIVTLDSFVGAYQPAALLFCTNFEMR
jgi:hypothetical protein